MKTLWTPWRMEYITNPRHYKKQCIFDLTESSRSDKKKLLLWRDDLVVVLMNRFPYANGHLLIAPVRHLADLTELRDEEHLALSKTISASTIILRRHLRPDGFNIGLNLGSAAGAGIAAHLHYHLVPRWQDDHNFLTVLAEVRTIPEHIDQTFDRLLADFQELHTTLG